MQGRGSLGLQLRSPIRRLSADLNVLVGGHHTNTGDDTLP